MSYISFFVSTKLKITEMCVNIFCILFVFHSSNSRDANEIGTGAKSVVRNSWSIRWTRNIDE